MKVLDLHCTHGHNFEGWFASEDDFLSQQSRALIQCPLCGDAQISKKLSAPRLHLSGARSAVQEPEGAVAVAGSADHELAKVWMEIGRHLMANTTDVGVRFAEEARKIHYGEVPERGIRGQTSAREARELIEEGIGVLPFMLPEALKGPLQ